MRARTQPAPTGRFYMIARLEVELRETRADLGTLLNHRLPKPSRLLVLAMHQRLSRLLGEDDQS